MRIKWVNIQICSAYSKFQIKFLPSYVSFYLQASPFVSTKDALMNKIERSCFHGTLHSND